MDLARPLIGLILAAVFGALAHRLGALTLGGALGAALVGGLMFGLGGWVPALLLIVFFVSSSALSFIGARQKRALAGKFAKQSRRDLGQVLANGGLPAALAVGYGLEGSPVWLAGLAGALAAANADTWATELGVLARRRPRRITTGEFVAPGTSGGVTPEGLFASAGGAGLIGLLGAAWPYRPALFVAASLGGFAGALFDSLLGASVQGVYICPRCEQETERHPLHSCGAATHPLRGWPWLSNDLVNFGASLAGAGFSALIYILL